MARIRTIKPSAFTSESLANVSIAANWTFAGLWTYVDDEGRGKADPRLIKGAVWPLRDAITPEHVREHLVELENEECVCRYWVGGREFVHVINWVHQSISKPTPSKIPPCAKHHGGPNRGPGDTGIRSDDLHSGGSPEWSGGSRGTPGLGGEGGREEGAEGVAAGRDGDSSVSGDPPEIPGGPGDSHAGTGNREQGSGTGNREQGTGTRALVRPDPGARFPEFWAIYPRSDDRKPALEKWAQVVRAGADPALIIQGAIRYRDDPNRDPGFTKQAKTWLNQACWENGPLPTRGGTRAKPSTTDARVGSALDLSRRLRAQEQQQHGQRQIEMGEAS